MKNMYMAGYMCKEAVNAHEGDNQRFRDNTPPPAGHRSPDTGTSSGFFGGIGNAMEGAYNWTPTGLAQRAGSWAGRKIPEYYDRGVKRVVKPWREEATDTARDLANIGEEAGARIGAAAVAGADEGFQDSSIGRAVGGMGRLGDTFKSGLNYLMEDGKGHRLLAILLPMLFGGAFGLSGQHGGLGKALGYGALGLGAQGRARYMG